jgi:hypothetical protein
MHIKCSDALKSARENYFPRYRIGVETTILVEADLHGPLRERDTITS